MTGRRTSTVCSDDECPELTAHPTGRCTIHRRARSRVQAQTRRANGDPSMDAYTTSTWRRTRHHHLHANPACEDCGRQATDIDHVPPRRILIALGAHDPDDPHWLHSRCHLCHSKVTRTIDQPLLLRLARGDDPNVLAELAVTLRRDTQRRVG